MSGEGEAMDPNDKTTNAPDETWTLAEPRRTGALAATGLEDYGYWLRWKQSLPPHDPADPKPFRRGVIWR